MANFNDQLKDFSKNNGIGLSSDFSLSFVEITNVEEFVDRVLKAKTEPKINVIGAAIKLERLKQNYTLEVLCEDICCPGYLSKIERNMVVRTDNAYVSKICDRLGLNYDDLINIKPSEIIMEAIHLYFNGQMEKLLDMACLFQNNVFVSSEELVKATIALTRSDLSEFRKIMSCIDEVKNTLSQEEVIYMLFVMIQYFIKTSQFIKCNKYMILLDRFSIKNKELLILIQEAKFITSINLNREVAKYEFIKLKNMFDDYPLTKQLNAKILYLVLLKEDEALKKVEALKKEHIYDECKETYYMVLSYIYIMNEKYVEVLDVLSDLDDDFVNTAKFISLFGLALLLLTKSKKFVTKKQLDKYNESFLFKCKNIQSTIDDVLHLSFLELIKYELEGKDSMFICDFIKLRYLDNRKYYQCFIYKKYIDVRYLYLLGLLSRYKDAYIYALENENILRNTRFYDIVNDIK